MRNIKPTSFSGLAASTALILLIACSALADDTDTQPSSTPTYRIAAPAAPNSVDRNLSDAQARPAGILKYGPVSVFDSFWDKVNDNLKPIGLQVGVSFTAVYQDSSGPGLHDAAGGDLDVFGEWRLLGAPDSKYKGLLYFYGEYRPVLGTEIPPASLGAQFGSLWKTTNGFNDQPPVFKELYWQQHFLGNAFILRLGKLDPENYYNSNYWQSDAKFFMNQAFSSFPVRAFPGNGLGMNLTANLSEDWYISTGFQDAQGQKGTAGFNTFFDDFNLFSAFELGYSPDIPNVGAGTYRITPWYRDAGESNGQPHDAGIDLSIDQRIGPNFVPFFRAGIGEGNINGITDMISAGLGWEGKLLTESDVTGFAASWGKPKDTSLRDQYALELFYRLQVSPDNQLMLGYQIIIDPASNPASNVVGVFELRWRIAI
jgi:hypothetical protein